MADFMLIFVYYLKYVEHKSADYKNNRKKKIRDFVNHANLCVQITLDKINTKYTLS